jgi:ariadne-1
MADDLPASKTAKLACGHRMCHPCLKRQFTLSVSDPQHMPPTCCSAEHIPLKAVERLFDDKFKILWNKKYQEYTTANRLYCPKKGCGDWIKPSKIRTDLTNGRKYARCGRCDTKVCVLCNSKFHTRRECPRDEETNRLVQMAKEKGWQRCYKCKAVVELKEGCNHMTW